MARVETQHRVGLEVEALVDFTLRAFSEDAWLCVGSMQGRVEGVVRLVSHHAGSLRILYHQGVFLNVRGGTTRLALLVVKASTTGWLAVEAEGVVTSSRRTILLLEKSHLFFASLLLRLVLIFEVLHFVFEFFQKLLNCRLILSC